MLLAVWNVAYKTEKPFMILSTTYLKLAPIHANVNI